MKKCPFCAEDIQDAAIKCRYCGSVLDEPATPAGPVSEPTAEPIKPDEFADVRDLAPVALLTPTTKPPRKPMSALGVLGVLVLILSGLFVLLLIGASITGGSHRPSAAPSATPARSTPKTVPTPVPAAQPAAMREASVSLERKLATIDCTCPVTDDDVRVLRFRSLLQQLSAKYGEAPERIADMSVACRNSLAEKGISESLMNIMEGFNQVLDRPLGKQHDGYAEYLALYIVNRNAGASHDKAIRDLRDLLDWLQK